MRLRITFKATDEKIPIGNRFMVCSLIKNSIEKGDKDLFEKIYTYKDKKNKKIKDFTFSIFLNDFDTKENYIEINGNITVTVSTPDYNLGIAIYNGLLKIREFEYKEFKLEIKQITLLKENKVNSNLITCKTLSPIFIRDRAGKAIDINDSQFEEVLNYICNLYIKNYRGDGLRKELKISPINMRKVVIKEEIAGFKEITGKEFIYIDSYKGLFNLEGDIEDLQILLQSGVGFRRSEGFGMIDLA